jgi:hypothetical protein
MKDKIKTIAQQKRTGARRALNLKSNANLGTTRLSVKGMEGTLEQSLPKIKRQGYQGLGLQLVMLNLG